MGVHVEWGLLWLLKAGERRDGTEQPLEPQVKWGFASNACSLPSLLSPAFNNHNSPPFHVNSHHMGSALFSSVLSQAVKNGIMRPMWGALFSAATRPCYGQKRAPLRYSAPSVSDACPLQSLLSPTPSFMTYLYGIMDLWGALFSPASVSTQIYIYIYHLPYPLPREPPPPSLLTDSQHAAGNG